MCHVPPAPVAEAWPATAPAPATGIHRLPVELIFCILELLGLQTLQPLRLVCQRWQAVVDRLSKSEHLIIALGEPPSWMQDGADGASGRPAPVSNWGDAQPARAPWMESGPIDLIRLTKDVGLLRALRFERLAQLVRLRSLWICADFPLDVDHDEGLELDHLAPLATLRELRLDVAIIPGAVQLPSVRRLQLAHADGSVLFLNFIHTFPNLRRLSCDVMQMNYQHVPSNYGHTSDVEELRLIETHEWLDEHGVQHIRRWMPQLRRLRLEAADAGRLAQLAAFAGLAKLTHVEYSSPVLDRHGLRLMPDLTDAVNLLRRQFRLDAVAVTLWGHRLLPGDDQAGVLHDYLYERQVETVGRTMHFPSAFDRIPLDPVDPVDPPESALRVGDAPAAAAHS